MRSSLDQEPMDSDGTSLSDGTTGLLHFSNRITSSLRLILLAMSADVVSDREHPLVTLGRDRMLRQLESRIAWPGKADSGSAMSCSARSKRVFTFCFTVSAIYFVSLHVLCCSCTSVPEYSSFVQPRRPQQIVFDNYRKWCSRMRRRRVGG
jgi:hypothetical protein